MSHKYFDTREDNIIFACTHCKKVYKAALNVCQCGNSFFKVAGMSTIYNPLINDPESQSDPYRKKKNSPETGIQYTDPFGFGSLSENATGTYNGPHGPEMVDEDGGIVEQLDTDNPADKERTLPSDGGVGDNFPSSANGDAMLPEDSPLHQNLTHPNPYNNMQSIKKVDPYDVIRQRRRKR